MKASWMLAALAGLAASAGLTAGPAVAQPLIAPSRTYGTNATPNPGAYATPKSSLDKSYGLPTFGTPGAVEPKQKTMEPKAVQPQQPDPFRPSTTLGTSEPRSSGTPDFFASTPNTNSSDTPDFFQSTPDSTLPKVQKSQAGGAATETPLFTTSQGMADDSSTADKPKADDTPDD